MDLRLFKKRCSAAETVPESHENRETEEERSNLGGAPALREPWRPRTRGGTLLPSRGKAKQEEEGGGPLSPSLPVAPECRRGNHRHRNHLHQHHRLHQHLHHLPPSIISGPLSRNPL